jgi:hypothetical protein
MGVNKFNCEGYYDPTAYEALTKIEQKTKALRAFRPVVYICSPLAGDTERNQENARTYCRFAVETGCVPIAPHIYFTQLLKKGQRDGIKDVGGFVGGHLREGRHKNGMVLCRSLLTMDMDYGTPDVWDEITLFHDFKCCVYSTHKHTPEHPRLRLLIPLKREISEEEYPAVARMVAKEIGIDLFDDTTYEASRLMYWPSTSPTANSSTRCRTVRSLTRMNTFPATMIGTTPPPGPYPAASPRWCSTVSPSRSTR